MAFEREHIICKSSTNLYTPLPGGTTTTLAGLKAQNQCARLMLPWKCQHAPTSYCVQADIIFDKAFTQTNFQPI